MLTFILSTVWDYRNGVWKGHEQVGLGQPSAQTAPLANTLSGQSWYGPPES